MFNKVHEYSSLTMEYWSLLPVGIVIATIASMLGIAGGIVWVPYLILVTDLDPRKAIMLSFAIQVVGMGSAVLLYIRRKMIFWPLALRMAPFIFAGMIVGAYVSQRIAEGSLIQLSVGVFSMSIAILFAYQTESYNATLNTNPKMKPPYWLRFTGVLMGSVSGFLSIGIGDVFIPIIRSRLKVPMQNAVGTALILNFFVAFTGATTHIFLRQEHDVNLLYAFAFGAVGVFIGGQIGSFFSQKFDENRLKEMFIFLLILIGLHMIYQSL